MALKHCPKSLGVNYWGGTSSTGPAKITSIFNTEKCGLKGVGTCMGGKKYSQKNIKAAMGNNECKMAVRTGID